MNDKINFNERLNLENTELINDVWFMTFYLYKEQEKYREVIDRKASWFFGLCTIMITIQSSLLAFVFQHLSDKIIWEDVYLFFVCSYYILCAISIIFFFQAYRARKSFKQPRLKEVLRKDVFEIAEENGADCYARFLLDHMLQCVDDNKHVNKKKVWWLNLGQWILIFSVVSLISTVAIVSLSAIKQSGSQELGTQQTESRTTETQ